MQIHRVAVAARKGQGIRRRPLRPLRPSRGAHPEECLPDDGAPLDRITGRRFAGGMQGLEKGHERGGLGRAQIFAVGGHVVAAQRMAVRHCLAWSTTAPRSSSGLRPLRETSGTGVLLHAFMSGGQGAKSHHADGHQQHRKDKGPGTLFPSEIRASWRPFAVLFCRDMAEVMAAGRGWRSSACGSGHLRLTQRPQRLQRGEIATKRHTKC